MNKSNDKKMKRNKLLKKSIDLKIIQILSIIILSFIYFKTPNRSKRKKLVIQVDISKSKRGKGGPIVLQRGISKVLPYEAKYCNFIPADGIP